MGGWLIIATFNCCAMLARSPLLRAAIFSFWKRLSSDPLASHMRDALEREKERESARSSAASMTFAFHESIRQIASTCARHSLGRGRHLIAEGAKRHLARSSEAIETSSKCLAPTAVRPAPLLAVLLLEFKYLRHARQAPDFARQ